MPKINIIRPPKISVDARKNFWKQILMIVVGTTISLVFTIAAATLMEKHQRAKDRSLTAMMVVAEIKGNAELFNGIYEMTARCDSVSQWLLNQPVEELELLPEDELQALVDEAFGINFLLKYDNTTEQIFSNNVETWKNVRNYQFIDLAGGCFELISSTVTRWNQWGDELEGLQKTIRTNRDEYPGKNFPVKCLRNDEIRRMLGEVHKNRCRILHQSQLLLYYFKKCMAVMDIDEEDFQEFLEKNQREIDIDMEKPSLDYDDTPFSPESLTTLHDLDARLDSLMGR